MYGTDLRGGKMGKEKSKNKDYNKIKETIGLKEQTKKTEKNKEYEMCVVKQVKLLLDKTESKSNK